MDTLEFFQVILPDTGPYYLTVVSPRWGNQHAHKSYPTLDAMAAAVELLDSYQDQTVYHACGSYKEPFYMDGEKKRYRKEPNWGRAKSLWCDIDCGPSYVNQVDKDGNPVPDRGYIDQLTAVKAILGFCKEASFPPPMIVDSGNGIHCYWPFTKSILPALWQKMGRALKAIFAHWELKIDPTRTADFASILRPVGSHNKKREPFKQVRVKRAVPPTPPEDLWDKLTKIVHDYGVKLLADKKEVDPLGAVPEHLKAAVAAGMNDDLLAHNHQNIPVDANIVADRCTQVAAMRDTKGDVGYDHWRGVIGILVSCENGRELAEEWSAERANTGHSNLDWDVRYDTWGAKPTSCEFFQNCNPTGCAGCPVKGSIKGPIMLGRVVPEPVEAAIIAEVDGVPETVVIPKLPSGFLWDEGQLTRYIKDKDGIPQPHHFSKTMYWPITRIKTELGKYAVLIRSLQHNNRVLDFIVDTTALASTTDLMKALAGGGEIMATNSKDSPMHHNAYLRDSLEALKAQAEEVNTMVNYGWREERNGFLIADRLYMPDGSMTKVMLGANAATHAAEFPIPRGSVQGYAAAVNAVYGHPDMTPLQYAFMNGFGSILSEFAESTYRGLLFAVTGGETAKGKTTVALACLYAFGDAGKMKLTRGRSGATESAAWQQMGCYNNLPLLFDELTNVEPEWLSNFTYTISDGIEKARSKMQGGVVVRAPRAMWRGSPYVNGNTDLHELLSKDIGNSAAEAARLIQIKIDQYALPVFDDGFVASRLHTMAENMGAAGEAFVKFVVANQATVQGMFDDEMGRISKHINGPKYRYYRAHAACTLAAAKITNQLGITDFSYERMFSFAVDLMRKLANDTAETNTLTPEEAFNRMITDLTPRILSTYEYRDSRDALGPEVTLRITQSIAGRMIRGLTKKPTPYDGRLYIIKKEFRDWCVKHRIEPSSIVKYAQDNNFLVGDSEKFSVTRGTEYPYNQHRCVVFDMREYGGSQAVHMTPTLVAVGGKPVAPPMSVAV